MKQGRLNVGVIGTEPAGIAMAQELATAGLMVVAVSTATLDRDDALEVLLPQAKRLTDIQILEAADLVLLAVPAAEITATVSDLSDSWRAGILSEALSKGAIPLAIHPAMRFTGTSLDLNRMKESFFAVSAPAVALPIAQALVIEMGAEPIVIESSARASYAEAIEVASNFSAMIVNQAIGLLEQAGVENPALVIAPVIESAVDQALSKGHRQIKPEDLIGDA
ncbi:MAG: DUF2520 domain-containing protein [Micrococcales bacterium]|nr:DUF2520 domain-containing protein [Micrococcales bacterium]